MAIVSCGLLLAAGAAGDVDVEAEAGRGWCISLNRGLRWDAFEASLLRHDWEQKSASAEACS